MCVHVFQKKKVFLNFLNFPSKRLACLQVGSQEDIYIRNQSRENHLSGASLAPVPRIGNTVSSQCSVGLSLSTHVTIRELMDFFCVCVCVCVNFVLEKFTKSRRPISIFIWTEQLDRHSRRHLTECMRTYRALLSKFSSRSYRSIYQAAK